MLRRARTGTRCRGLGGRSRRYVRRVFELCRYMFEQRPKLRALIFSKLVLGHGRRLSLRPAGSLHVGPTIAAAGGWENTQTA